nr:hypothetical protein CFP56_12495 [Quercus suber]
MESLNLVVGSNNNPSLKREISRQETKLSLKKGKTERDAPEAAFDGPVAITTIPKSSLIIPILEERQNTSDAKCTAVGVCIMWKEGLMIHQVEYNKNLIAMKVSDALCSWVLIGFYGPPYLS